MKARRRVRRTGLERSEEEETVQKRTGGEEREEELVTGLMASGTHTPPVPGLPLNPGTGCALRDMSLGAQSGLEKMMRSQDCSTRLPVGLKQRKQSTTVHQRDLVSHPHQAH